MIKKLYSAIVSAWLILLSGCSSHSSVRNHNVDTRPRGGIPFYGNWCGPGHPQDADTNPPAIDALDEACRLHDLCYKNTRYTETTCDRELISSLSNTNWTAPQQRVVSEITQFYFAISPSVSDKTVFSYLTDPRKEKESFLVPMPTGSGIGLGVLIFDVKLPFYVITKIKEYFSVFGSGSKKVPVDESSSEKREENSRLHAQ